MPFYSSEVPVEILDLSPRWLTGGLAASFARVQILVTFYDGDPLLWLDAIERGETPGDEADELFLQNVLDRMILDPKLLPDMRRIVGEFAARFGAM
ncbi:MAG: hypothetical protein ABI779_27310 [Acidobacteriota bacterium]